MNHPKVIVSGFQSSCEVTSSRYLFGHNKPSGLLAQITNSLKMGTNVQLLGERRSGKTSLLKCCLENFSKTKNLIAVYLNFRELQFIRGYADTHRYILASILSSCPAKYLTKLDALVQSRDVNQQFQMLGGIPDHRVNRVLSESIDQINGMNAGVILLIDEYEHLIRYTFEGKEGAFFQIRDLASKPSQNVQGPKPLTYIIAGATPWNELCQKIGSPELNNIGALKYIEPVDRDSFHLMWKTCIEESSTRIQKNIIDSKYQVDEIYTLAGGWPFYGKIIGEHLGAGIHDQSHIYETLLQHFSVIWTRMSNEEKNFLLSTPLQNVPENTNISRALIRRGLLEIKENKILPLGTFWGKFLSEHKDSEGFTSLSTAHNEASTSSENQITLLTIDITELITEINEISISINGGEIFRCSNQDIPTYKDLRTPAHTAEQFSQFSLSLYNIFFERTTGARNIKVPGKNGENVKEEIQYKSLELLPKDFRRQRTMIKTIDIVRHHFGKGHLTRLDTFNVSKSGLPIEQVLEKYLGSKLPPTVNQFEVLQLKILEDIIVFLNEIKSYLIANATKSNANA